MWFKYRYEITGGLIGLIIGLINSWNWIDLDWYIVFPLVGIVSATILKKVLKPKWMK